MKIKLKNPKKGLPKGKFKVKAKKNTGRKMFAKK